MAVHAGQRRLGPDRGRITLHTSRDGLASQAGHDLTIDVTRWSGELAAGDDGTPTGLDVTVDMNSLTVTAGTGGVKPLSDRDRREIAVTARKTLEVDRYPEAKFTAESFQPGAGGGGTITGTFTLHGVSKPLRLEVSEMGQDRYRATGTVVQSEFGIKPYSGFLGALRVRDAVQVEAEVDLSETGTAQGPGT
jgi:polyisoprenoid-binding protein YceI